MKSFTKAESHFVDVRFFEEDDTPKETIPLTISSVGGGSMTIIIQVPKEDMLTH